MNQKDLGALCVCANRYCRGRRTYMPSLIHDIIKNHLTELSDSDVRTILEDTKDIIDSNETGDEHIDRAEWIKFKDTLEIYYYG